METIHDFELDKKFEVSLPSARDMNGMFRELGQYFRTQIGHIQYVSGSELAAVYDEVLDSKARPAIALSSALFKNYRINMTDEQKAAVGTIIDRYTVKPSQYVYDFSHALDWKVGMYGDSGSCYWSERAQSRKLMKSHADFLSIRFYYPRGLHKDRGLARAIIYVADKSFAIFNAYSCEGTESVSLLTAARVLSYHVHGNPIFHDRADAGNCRSGNTGMLWINSAVVHLIPKEKAGRKDLPKSFNFNLKEFERLKGGHIYECHGCDDEVYQDEAHVFDGHYYCSDCYHDVAFIDCHTCGKEMHIYDDQHFTYKMFKYCPSCYDKLPRCHYSYNGRPTLTEVPITLTGNTITGYVYSSHLLESHICDSLHENGMCDEHYNQFSAECPNCHTTYALTIENSTFERTRVLNRNTGLYSWGRKKVINFTYVPHLPCPNCIEKGKHDEYSFYQHPTTA